MSSSARALAEHDRLKAGLLVEEICNQLDGGLWILLHDPVPGVGHDAACDVARDELHMIGHVFAEELLGTGNGVTSATRGADSKIPPRMVAIYLNI